MQKSASPLCYHTPDAHYYFSKDFFGSTTFLGQKLFWVKNFYVSKTFLGSKKIFGSKLFLGPQFFLGPKLFYGPKLLGGSKKFWGPKHVFMHPLTNTRYQYWSIPDLGQPPYFFGDFFSAIGSLKSESEVSLAALVNCTACYLNSY